MQNFRRTFGALQLSKVASIKLPFNSYTIQHLSSTSVTLGNRKAQRLLMTVTIPGMDTSVTIIPESNLLGIDFRDPSVAVSSSEVIIADGALGIISKSKRDFGLVTQIKTPTFSQMVPLGGDRYALRTYNEETSSDELSLFDCLHDTVYTNADILDKQIDGIFCVDGMMLYNGERHAFLYVYYYHNEFITSDESLLNVKKWKSIDRTDTATFKIASYKSGERTTTTFSSAPRLVNVRAFTSLDYLYILSNERAINQTRADFESSYTIDRYHLKDGRYEGSFLITKPVDAEVINMDVKAYQDMIVVVLNDDLVVYRLNNSHLTDPLPFDPK